jgi:hypothetical protein
MGEGVTQIGWVITTGKMHKLNQLRGMDRLEEGSKMENSLFIIFKLGLMVVYR